MRVEPGRTALPGIMLREALPSDEALLKRLYRSARQPEMDMLPWSEAQKDAFCDSQFALQDRFYRENFVGMQMLVIEHGTLSVGRLYLHSMQSELNLMDITLEPQARGKGIGGSLVAWLQEEAARHGQAIVLHVEMNNRARNLYARLGFLDETPEGIYLRMRWTPAALKCG